MIKNRLAESRGNLKTAKEKLKKQVLWWGDQDIKYLRNPQRFSFQLMVEIDISCNVNNVGRSKENHREVQGRRAKEWRKRKRKFTLQEERRKNHPKHRVKKRDIFVFAPSLLKRSTMVALTSGLRVTRKRISFSLRNFFTDCATNSLLLSVCKYTGIRLLFFASTRWKAFIMQFLDLSVLSRRSIVFT